MRIGIFDSGLGGLVIAKQIFKKLPQYDYVYLGDTKRVPYGNREQTEVLKFTENALKYLFAKDCELVIIACNTSSAKALRKIQQNFLPKYFPDKKVLGVIVPTVEEVARVTATSTQRVGVLATKSTVSSHAYKRELAKVGPKLKVYEQAAPLLVPFIESNRILESKAAIKKYLQPLLEKHIQILILACTHYPLLKRQIKSELGTKIKILSQEQIIAGKLKDYLKRHKEIDELLSKGRARNFFVTKTSKEFQEVAAVLFGKQIDLKVVNY